MSTKKKTGKISRSPRPPVPVGAGAVAHAQAKAFAKNALTLGKTLSAPAEAGTVLVYLANAGFAVELYLKTFMITGRGGQVLEGHDLVELLNDFPVPLRHSFNAIYDTHSTAKSAPVGLLSLILSDGNVEMPAYQHTGRYGTFDQAIAAIATVFVDARYFFEGVNTKDWIVFSYPVHAIEAIFDALEKTYQMYLSGAFDEKK